MSASEAAVQTAIRIRAGELGIHLWRNNVGACVDDTGRMIRYGLANDSAQMSKRIKSGDLIGIVPIKARKEIEEISVTLKSGSRMFAAGFGTFVSIECKHADWHGGPDAPIDPAKFNPREVAQMAWIALIRKQGGLAGFARSVGEFEAILQGYLIP